MKAESDPPPALRPVWLRPALLTVILGLHIGAALSVTIAQPVPVAADDTLEITIAQGAPPEPEPAPPPPEPEPPPPPPDPPPPPEPAPAPEPPPPDEPPPPVIPDAPKRVAADAPVIAAPPKPPKPKPRPVPPEAPPPEQKPQGAEQAEDQRTQLRATYAGKVLQEIRAHRLPASGSGSVVVAFAIDPDGEMTSVTVVRSSGTSALDAIAVRMVRAARPGAPPDGGFAGSTTINFVQQ